MQPVPDKALIHYYFKFFFSYSLNVTLYSLNVYVIKQTKQIEEYLTALLTHGHYREKKTIHYISQTSHTHTHRISHIKFGTNLCILLCVTSECFIPTTTTTKNARYQRIRSR